MIEQHLPITLPSYLMTGKLVKFQFPVGQFSIMIELLNYCHLTVN